MILERKTLKELREQTKNRKISILIGPRQVGKTSLLKMIYNELKTEKKIFLDLDVLSNYEKIESFEKFVNFLRFNGYEEKQKEFFYVFLDEFQRYPTLSLILKNVYDNLENVKIFASGSSSLNIKDKIKESLAGRKIINFIYPLDFEEFLFFKGRKDLIEKLAKLNNLEGEEISLLTNDLKEALEEFLVFGSYPEVVLAKTKEEKIKVLNSIFDLFVQKDLIGYLKSEKVPFVKKLIEFLAINNGKKIKYSEAGETSSLSYLELKRIIFLLEECFLIKEVRPFFKNKNKEIVKIPKIYFLDCGVRNFYIKNFNELHLRDDGGFLFETFILSELIKKGYEEITFWNDKNLEEVDFILNREGKIIPIEVKFKEKLKESDLSGLKNFINNYKTKNSYLINLGKQKKEDEIIFVLPYLIKV